MMKAVLEAGGDSTRKNAEGNNPLDIAVGKEAGQTHLALHRLKTLIDYPILLERSRLGDFLFPRHCYKHPY